MVRFPNCKINLGLYITNRHADGYHDLETVFYPVPFRDALEIVPAKDKASIHLSGRTVAGDSTDNLVWKAYQMLKEKFPQQVGELDIYLHKAIPMGAGLGGGSADGAFMLQLLSDHFKIGLTDAQLVDTALQLGSDCPFFIYNTPQFAKGRGEQMTPINLDLSGFSLLLICPSVHVSTGKAFQMITPRPAPFDLRELDKLPVIEWKDNITNDFEAPIFEQHPELAAIKQQLYTGGAVYASMSGSGSTIFGLFPKGRKTGIITSLDYESFYVE
ncbi:4-(cytidine 5'-diphospho)-2-C-methyl-D-erythritol kinase [Polluticoccus soli]|uniref:4-(cytidine 5'-diphospho)-2-C-methyl-D-erythritol kinase n=1 Tax=Polluticoccus soli TaxID=3034150 RepID=UPI0023E2EEB9|nr:4-(cytidine 5'-diphospho)-2-C-methyl-D-erythritol kinase [Flavipsychrobacter sp. JY13-12]